MSKITNQVKEILTDSAARLEALKGEGMKVADKVRGEGKKVAEKVRGEGKKVARNLRQQGTKAFAHLAADITPKDLMDRFGTLKVPELIEKLKSSELARHADAIRAEVLQFLRVPSTETVEELHVAVDKLTKEVAGLKGLKAEVKKVADEVKAGKTAAKKATKE